MTTASKRLFIGPNRLRTAPCETLEGREFMRDVGEVAFLVTDLGRHLAAVKLALETFDLGVDQARVVGCYPPKDVAKV